MQILFFIMAFTNAAAILFFALRYTFRTIHEKRAQRAESLSLEGDFQLSM